MKCGSDKRVGVFLRVCVVQYHEIPFSLHHVDVLVILKVILFSQWLNSTIMWR